MKAAIITDTHFGVRGDSPFFAKKQKEFLDKVFFPALKEHEASYVFHLGDLFDNRIKVNINTLDWVCKEFIYPIEKDNIFYIQVLGNHDCYRKDSNSPNLPFHLMRDPEFDVVQDNVFDDMLDTSGVVFVPWINNNLEFQAKILQQISDIPNKSEVILMGHFQIEGCRMPGGQLCEHGTPQSFFKQFKKVLSGHFHNPSILGNIQYIGNPFYTSWADYGDEKGFYIMDLDNHEMEFISNPDKVFHKINLDDLQRINPEAYQEQIIRIYTSSIVDNRKAIEEILEPFTKGNNQVEVIEENPEIQKLETFILDESQQEALKDEKTEDLIRLCVEKTDNLQSDKKELNDYLINLMDEVEFNNGKQ